MRKYFGNHFGIFGGEGSILLDITFPVNNEEIGKYRKSINRINPSGKSQGAVAEIFNVEFITQKSLVRIQQCYIDV